MKNHSIFVATITLLSIASCRGSKSQESHPMLAVGSTLAPGYRCQMDDEEMIRLNPQLGQENDFIWTIDLSNQYSNSVLLTVDQAVLKLPREWGALNNQVELRTSASNSKTKVEISQEYSKNPNKLVLHYRVGYDQDLKASIDIESGKGQLTFFKFCEKRRPIALKCKAMSFAAQSPKTNEKLSILSGRIREIPRIDFRYRKKETQTEASDKNQNRTRTFSFYSFVSPDDESVYSILGDERAGYPIVNEKFEILGYRIQEDFGLYRNIPVEIENYFRKYASGVKTTSEPLKREMNPMTVPLDAFSKAMSDFACHLLGQLPGSPPAPRKEPIPPKEPIKLTYLGDSAYTIFSQYRAVFERRGLAIAIPSEWKELDFIKAQFEPDFEHDIREGIVRLCHARSSK